MLLKQRETGCCTRSALAKVETRCSGPHDMFKVHNQSYRLTYVYMCTLGSAYISPYVVADRYAGILCRIIGMQTLL